VHWNPSIKPYNALESRPIEPPIFRGLLHRSWWLARLSGNVPEDKVYRVWRMRAYSSLARWSLTELGLLAIRSEFKRVTGPQKIRFCSDGARD